jgi:hypothetical protein
VLDETLGKDIAIGARDGLLYVQNGAGLTVGEFTLIDNQIKIANPARDMIVGTTGATADVVFNRSIRVKDRLGRTALYTDRTGRTQFYVPTILASTDLAPEIGGVSIIGTPDGNYHGVTSPGGMLHITGNDGASNRFSMDAFGAGGNQSFNGLIARAGRGTSSSPSQLLAGDIILRLAGTGWRSDTGFSGVAAGGASTSLDFVSLEATADATRGSAQAFYNAPLGGNTRTFSGLFNATGLSFVKQSGDTASATIGITFSNNDRLTYFPTPVGQTNLWLKSNGTTMSWQSLPVAENPVIYKGSWNANTNASPVIISTNGNINGAAPTQGWEYSISATGTIDIGAGSQLYSAGGFIIWSGTSWSYIPPVVGVASIKFDSGITRSGVVSVVSSDITSTLDTGSIANSKLANSSVSVVAGTGLSGGGTVSLGGTITVTNAGVTAISTSSGLSTNTNATGSVTITNTGVLSVASGGHITATTVAGAVTLGSDATVNDTNNTIALRDIVGGIAAKDFTATLDASIPSDHGPFNYGTLSYSDTGIMADFSYSTNGYNQVVVQNRNSGSNASANFIVSNNQGTASVFYGEFGMNSSGFTGTGSLALPNAVYLNSVSSDLVLGGTALHFVIGTGADAVSINSSGVATFANTISGSISGNSATANQVNHTVTFAATGGAAAGAAFDGSAAKIIDYHTVGAQVAGTYVTSVSGAGVISVTSGTTPQVSISQATGSTSGYLSSTDWTLFNNKSNTTGTVTSIGGTGTVSGLTLSGTVTSSGNLTLGGTLTLTSGNVTTALGFTPYNATNPAGYTTNTGTVTSIAASTTPVNGLSLSGGTITTSGTIAITGTLSGITNSNLSGTAGITNANLANSTISGVSLGGSLYNLTAGVGITFSSGTTYNGSAAITVNNSITQYTDALARATLSAGTGISYSSSTGVISSTITQYTDALARAAISVSGSLSYNSSSGVISYTTPTYTV